MEAKSHMHGFQLDDPEEGAKGQEALLWPYPRLPLGVWPLALTSPYHQ